MDSYQTTDHEEIAIDSVEGLAALLEFANDLLLEINDLTKTATDDARYHDAREQAEVVFLKLQTLIEKHTKVLDLGGYLTTDDTDTIQQFYDELAQVRDELDDTETFEAPQAEAATAVAVASPLVAETSQNLPIITASPTPVTVTESIPSLESTGDELEERDASGDDESAFVDEELEVEDEPELPTTKQVSGSLQVQDGSETASAAEINITATPIDTETVRRQLRALAKTADPLMQKADTMQQEYSELATVDEDDEDLKNGVYLYQQLLSSTAQVHELVDEVEQRLKNPAKDDLDLFLIHATDELAEYAENLESIDKGLEWYFDDVEGGQGEVTRGAESQTTPRAASASVEKLYRPGLFKKDELRPYIDAVVMEPEYKRFLSNRFASPTEFEAYLRREIITREAPSKLDKVLGIVHQSPFDSLLCGMTVASLEQFDQQPVESLRAALQEKDIQYEFYVDWMHTYPIMKHLVGPHSAMTFGELFVRAMVEDMIDQSEAAT